MLSPCVKENNNNNNIPHNNNINIPQQDENIIHRPQLDINDNIPQEDINNNDNLPQNNRISPIVTGIIIFITILISVYNIYNLFHIVNIIKNTYLLLPYQIFEECYLYQEYLNLFIEFISFFLGMDLILLITIPIFDNNTNLEIFFDKYSKSFVYFNYLIFGPFIMGCLFLGIKHYDKFIYSCSSINPIEKKVNYRLFVLFIFGILLSSLITFFGSYYFENEFFSNSIKCRSSGNYIIGNLFWDYALKRSRRFKNRQNINNLNLNEEILDNEENNQGEKHN